MEFQLKNVKYYAGMSEETLAYKASLYADGKKVADVGNQGCGGCDFVHWSVGNERQRDILAAVEAANAITGTDREKAALIRSRIRVMDRLGDCSYHATMCDETDAWLLEHQSHLLSDPFFSASLESICHELLQRELAGRDLKRNLKRRVLYIDAEKRVMATQTSSDRRQLGRWADEIAEEQPDAIILNRMGFDKALDLYLAHAA